MVEKKLVGFSIYHLVGTPGLVWWVFHCDCNSLGTIVMILSFQLDGAGQTLQKRSLIRVFIVSVFLRHYSMSHITRESFGSRGGSVVERRTPEQEVLGLNPTTAV